MSNWDTRIREHPVFEKMSTLGPLIDEVLNAGPTTEAVFAGLERLRAVLAYCGRRIAAADPLLATPGPMNAVSIAFEHAATELKLFLSNRNDVHITNANADADTAIEGIAQVPSAQSTDELGDLARVASDYRTHIESDISVSRKAVTELRAGVEGLSGDVTSVRSSLESEQKRLNEMGSKFQEQFSTAQDKRSEDFAATLRQQQASITTLTTEHQSQFSTAQETRGKEFIQSQATRQEKFSEVVDEYSQKLKQQDAEFSLQRKEYVDKQKENLDELQMKYRETAEGILNGVNVEKLRIEKLVGVIGNLGVTSGYLRNANRARTAMYIWQSLTVAAMIVLIWLAYKTLPLLEDKSGHFNWGGFAGRVVLLGSLGVLAAYAGSQADKQFEAEKRNRRLALELEAIGPFLAPLPEDEQHKFRIQIGERTFGQEEVVLSAHGKSPATLVDLLRSKESKEVAKEFIGLLADFVKKSR